MYCQKCFSNNYILVVCIYMCVCVKNKGFSHLFRYVWRTGMKQFITTEMDLKCFALTVTLDEFCLILWCFYIAEYITSNNSITNPRKVLWLRPLYVKASTGQKITVAFYKYILFLYRGKISWVPLYFNDNVICYFFIVYIWKPCDKCLVRRCLLNTVALKMTKLG